MQIWEDLGCEANVRVPESIPQEELLPLDKNEHNNRPLTHRRKVVFQPERVICFQSKSNLSLNSLFLVIKYIHRTIDEDNITDIDDREPAFLYNCVQAQSERARGVFFLRLQLLSIDNLAIVVFCPSDIRQSRAWEEYSHYK